VDIISGCRIRGHGRLDEEEAAAAEEQAVYPGAGAGNACDFAAAPKLQKRR